MDFLDIKTVYTIISLFGIALGAGSAFLSDFIFLKALKDKKITKDEFAILKTGSSFIAIGLLLYVFAGIGLFTLDHETLILSSTFLVKATLVGVLVINGLIFQSIHMPKIGRSTGRNLFGGEEVKGKLSFLVLSGVISTVSWIFVIILGAFSAIPYGYYEILLVYILVLILAIIIAWMMERKILSEGEKKSLGGSVIVLGSLLIISVIVLTQLKDEGIIFDADDSSASAIESQDLRQLDLKPNLR